MAQEMPCSLQVAFGHSPSGEPLVGEEVQFHNESDDASAWEWRVNGKLVSKERNLTRVFEEEGTYKITLRGYSEKRDCWSEHSYPITVLKEPCPLEVSFKASPKGPWVAGQTIHFENTSQINASWEWLLDGKVNGSTTHWERTFKKPGTYVVTLRGFSKKYGCWATFSMQIVVLPSEAMFCGSEKRAEPFDPTHGEFAVFDRFGNGYTLNEISIEGQNSGTNVPRQAKAASFTGCDCQTEFGINTGSFDVFFEDCNLNTGSGFDDATASTFQSAPSTLGKDRRRMVCQVFADLANTLTPGPGACATTTPDKVNVLISPSAYGSMYPAMNPGVGGTGSGFLTTMGSTDGEMNVLPNVIYNTGSAPPILANAYHGRLRFNFHTFPYAWHYDHTVSPPLGGYDFYSVALHEALHFLGFGSYITDFGSGNYGSMISGGTSGGFSGWDAEIRKVLGNVDIIDNTAAYAHFLEPSLTLPNDFQESCSGNGNDLVIGTNSVPLYTGTSFQPGASLSHLDESCNGNTYVMHPTLGSGVAKTSLSTDELSLLNDLGYDTGSGSCIVHAGYDFFNSCGSTFSLSACAGQWIRLWDSDLLGNDPNGTTVVNMEVVSGPITVQPFFPTWPAPSWFVQATGGNGGVAVLRYQTQGCSGQLSNVSYVEINLLDCSTGACAFTGTYPYTNPNAVPAAGCGTASNPDCVDCGMNKNPDNLVCNPEMCSNETNINLAINDYHHLLCGATSPSGPGFELPGWFRGEESPGYIIRNFTQTPGTWRARFPQPIDATSGFIHLGTINSNESIWTPVDFDPGGDYLISVFGEGAGYNTGIDLDVQVVTQNGANSFFSCSYGGGVPTYGTNIHRVWYQRFWATNVNGASVNTGTWDRRGSFFQVPGNMPAKGIAFKARRLLSGSADFFMDNVEIVKDPFHAGPDEVKNCPGQPVILGGSDFEFPMLSDVRVRYVWTNQSTGATLLDYWTERERNGNYTIYDNLAGTTVPAIPSVTENPLVSTTYRLTRSFLTDPDGRLGGLPANTFNGITLSDDREVAVSVGPTATANFTFTINCLSATFTSEPTEVGANFGHSWDFDNDGTLDSYDPNPTYTFAGSGSYVVTHYVTTQCGTVFSSQQTVTITAPPAAGPVTFPMQIQAAGTDFGGSLAVGSQGLYVAGIAFGATQLPQATGTVAPGNVYVAHYEPNGCGLQWDMSFPASVSFPFSNLEPLDIEVNATNELYLLFNFTGSFTINGTTHTSAGGVDYAVVKVNAAGVPQYAVTGGGVGDDYAHDMELVGSDIKLTGRVNGSTGSFTIGTGTVSYQAVAGLGPDFTPGIGFTASYTDGGTNIVGQWADDLGAYVVPTRLATDPLGNSYVVANHYAPFTFAGNTLSPMGVGVAVFSYQANGTPRWATTLGGPGQDVDRSNNQTLEDIAVNTSGRVFVSFNLGGAGQPSPSSQTIGSQLVGLDAATGGITWQTAVADAGTWNSNYNGSSVQDTFTGAVTISRGLALTPTGDVIVGGFFQAGHLSSTNSQPTLIAGTGPYSSTHFWNSYIARYDAAGNPLMGFANTSLVGNPSTVDETHDLFLMDMVVGTSGELYTSMALDGTANLGAAITTSNHDLFVTRQTLLATSNYYRPLVQSVISTQETPLEVVIYPNPSSGIFNLEVKNFQAGRLMIRDLLGRAVHEERLTTSRQALNLTHLSEGTYVMSIQMGQKIINRKVIIQ